MVGVKEGREVRFRGDLYSQESTFPLVVCVLSCVIVTPRQTKQIFKMPMDDRWMVEK